jgi:hypothetical protein
MKRSRKYRARGGYMRMCCPTDGTELDVQSVNVVSDANSQVRDSK